MDRNALSLPLSVSEEYEVTDSSTESISGPIPEMRPTTQHFVEITKDGKKAYIFYWDGYPYRNLGPMAEKESWSFQFLGEKTSIKRSTLFMGQEQEVLVLHYKPDSQTYFMIYSKDMNREEFQGMLSKMGKK